MSNPEARTKIVATLGPASWSPETLDQLLVAGVDVCRINCSHADHEGIRRQVARVRQAASRVGQPTAILLDLQGPKIRIGKVDGQLELASGDTLTVVMDKDVMGSGHRVGTTYPEMAGDVKAGDLVLFADGALAGTVADVRREATPPEVDITIQNGGVLTSNKGMNLPGVDMSVPCLTEKDVPDLEVGLEMGVDYVALSFVRRASDVLELRERMTALGQIVPIIAKIEKPEALANLEDILAVSEGVMVARGDLGVEIPLEQVPVQQKRIIDLAQRKGKLCITATQMLDSMERNPRPTRAETTDVANAILDGTDAVMLSGETSVGAWPVLAVRTMNTIAADVEASPWLHSLPLEHLAPNPGPSGSACRAAAWAMTQHPRNLLVFTWSGATARYVSKVRGRGRIFATSPDPRVVDQLSLVWGVMPFHLPLLPAMQDLIAAGEALLLERGLITPGEELIILGGNGPHEGSTNFVKFHTVQERS